MLNTTTTKHNTQQKEQANKIKRFKSANKITMIKTSYLNQLLKLAI